MSEQQHGLGVKEVVHPNYYKLILWRTCVDYLIWEIVFTVFKIYFKNLTDIANTFPCVTGMLLD